MPLWWARRSVANDSSKLNKLFALSSSHPFNPFILSSSQLGSNYAFLAEADDGLRALAERLGVERYVPRGILTNVTSVTWAAHLLGTPAPVRTVCICTSTHGWMCVETRGEMRGERQCGETEGERM